MNKITNKICSILLVCLLSGCGNNNSTSSLSSSSSDISSSTLSSEESSSKNEKVKISYEEFLGYVYKKYDDNSYNHIFLFLY